VIRSSLDGLTLTLLAALGLSAGCKKDGPPVECINPVPIMQEGTNTPSGFYECESGLVHRAEAVECVAPDAPDNTDHCTQYAGGECDSAVDCQDRPYGGCMIVGDGTECACNYGCATDADCEDGYVCACAGVVSSGSKCIPAGCSTSERCNDGLCGLSSYCSGCDPFYSLACADPGSECLVNADCEPSETGEFQCSAHPDGEFSCKPLEYECGSVCGRPFLIEGQARVAGSVRRGDWCVELGADRFASIDAKTRRRLAEHWTRIASFEHASVASFVRASVDLLALGAPPALILATQRALLDEIEHARLAFGLASAYAGTLVGPGAIAIGGAIAERIDARTIVEGLVYEACVGETLAALEAREAAAWAENPVVASILEQIAADELRHAELGWQTLRWMLEQGDASLREFALAKLELAMREAEVATSEDGLRGHGVLDEQLRSELRLRALASIRQCVTALAARHRASAPDHRACA
jgi:hypothetical protein